LDLGNSDLPTSNPPNDRDAAEYCREIEAYLCRKNDGHLIRIVGPAFEQVCSWVGRGVPLKVAYRGIDRYFERYYAKGARRRPVRVEFCEADVLDVFDEWRRAVGVSAIVPPVDAGEPADHAARRASLPAHLERVVARLTALRAGDDRSLDAAIDATVRELDAARAGSKALRGDARQHFLARLQALDASLLDAARARCDARYLQQLGAEADAELAPFRDRMPRDAYDQSRRACIDRLIRERSRLPVVRFE
jgi:hypothetical protein